ncbi:MAG: tannase/feruloyl esterase family alpha/beta hydrolase [Acidobacteria bacterium]|nr:tannase/feruloyl esterase family alpha/beta hydrolase [Acidobacteriota bacterium]
MSFQAKHFQFLTVLCAVVLQVAVGALSAKADRCTDLSNLSLADVTSITATSVPANTFLTPPPFPGLPPGPAVPVAFCRVQITMDSLDFTPPQLNIEVWLPNPDKWNRRFQAEGGGGYAGGISYSALAAAVVGDSVTGPFATASTDTGHPAGGTANGQGGANGAQGGGGFALNPASDELNWGLIVDFASRSEHQMTLKAKDVIRAYYGDWPKYSYWNGCSTGGRQGWMEAQHYPDDYDGILAGAPAFNWDRFIPAELWPELAMKLNTGGPISQTKLNAVTAAAIKRCDAKDGVVDGVIGDPRKCNFDPHELICGRAGAPTDSSCLSDPEADAVKEIWRGARGPHGEFLWYGLEPGTSFAGLANTAPFTISLDHWRLWIKQNPSFDWQTLDVASFKEGFEQSREKFHDEAMTPVGPLFLSADDPNLEGFRRHRGKIITYHGWTDQLIFPRGSIDYFQRVTEANGGLEATGNFDRLFMVPGMNHCAGGAGAVNFGQSGVVPVSLDPEHDAVVALMRWVEKGIAPDHFVATTDPQPLHAAENSVNPGTFTRRLCPYPAIAKYKGGDPNSAGSFVCIGPHGEDDNDRGRD